MVTCKVWDFDSLHEEEFMKWILFPKPYVSSARIKQIVEAKLFKDARNSFLFRSMERHLICGFVLFGKASFVHVNVASFI